MFNIFSSNKQSNKVDTIKKVNNLLNRLKTFKPSVIYLGDYYWKGLPNNLKYDFYPTNIQRNGRFATLPIKKEVFYRNVLLKLDENNKYRFDIGDC